MTRARLGRGVPHRAVVVKPPAAPPSAVPVLSAPVLVNLAATTATPRVTVTF